MPSALRSAHCSPFSKLCSSSSNDDNMARSSAWLDLSSHHASIANANRMLAVIAAASTKMRFRCIFWTSFTRENLHFSKSGLGQYQPV